MVLDISTAMLESSSKKNNAAEIQKDHNFYTRPNS